MAEPRLLTFNCHEPYLHLLSKLGLPIDAVDGLPGRAHRQWDVRARPVPEGLQLVAPSHLHATGIEGRYRAVIAHNLTDLLAVRHLALPKVLVLHVSLTARHQEERPSWSVDEMVEQVRTYCRLTGALPVGVSDAKLRSWGLEDSGLVIAPGIDGRDYDGHRGEIAAGLRVVNHASARRERFAWDVHERVSAGFELRLVGDDPALGTRAAGSWDELRELYRAHRYYLHTALEGLDDGYNLAVLEAMGTGMPVVTNPSSNSPVRDGESGFVGDERHLRAGIERLTQDQALARRLGEAARRSVLRDHGMETFKKRWFDALDAAARHAEAKLGSA